MFYLSELQKQNKKLPKHPQQQSFNTQLSQDKTVFNLKKNLKNISTIILYNKNYWRFIFQIEPSSTADTPQPFNQHTNHPQQPFFSPSSAVESSTTNTADFLFVDPGRADPRPSVFDASLFSIMSRGRKYKFNSNTLYNEICLAFFCRELHHSLDTH